MLVVGGIVVAAQFAEVCYAWDEDEGWREGSVVFHGCRVRFIREWRDLEREVGCVFED